MNESAKSIAAPEHRVVGTEANKTIAAKHQSGFVARYLSGANILDIGYRGYSPDALPIVPQAIGVDLQYPGYDGKTLPFGDNSQDAVFSSHCLEHIDDYVGTLREWHRVLRVGGYMIVTVPHQFLYEKKATLPSRWNTDHKRLYTPSSLMREVEEALTPNSYRLRHLIDNDLNFTYESPPDRHSGGCYEIEMVLEKIQGPSWSVNHDLMNIEIGPDSALIGWIGFSHSEGGFRWTVGKRAAMQFHLSASEADSLRARFARISITVDAFGTQRVHVRLNDLPAYHKSCIGQGVVLDIPTNNLRAGLNNLEFILPDAGRVAADPDQRQLGIAVRKVILHGDPRHGRKTPGAKGLWGSVTSLFGRE